MGSVWLSWIGSQNGLRPYLQPIYRQNVLPKPATDKSFSFSISGTQDVLRGGHCSLACRIPLWLNFNITRRVFHSRRPTGGPPIFRGRFSRSYERNESSSSGPSYLTKTILFQRSSLLFSSFPSAQCGQTLLGPTILYQVIARNLDDRVFTIIVNGSESNVSLERLKPVHLPTSKVVMMSSQRKINHDLTDNDCVEVPSRGKHLGERDNCCYLCCCSCVISWDCARPQLCHQVLVLISVD